jgi:DUF4097 and DUF4098 domain-containing protein YvlB
MTQEATMYTFPTPGPTNLRVELGVGRCNIRAEDTDTTTVELVAIHGDSHAQELVDRSTVEQRGDNVVVLVPKAKGGLFGRKGEVEATIVVPTATNVDVQLGSADLDTRGTLGRAKVGSGSGDITLEAATDVTAKSGSGDLRIDRATGSVSSKGGSSDTQIGFIGGDFEFLTGSGDIEVKQIHGSLRGKAGSGDIEIGQAGDGVDIILGSGDLDIARADRGLLKAKTGSGDVTIGVANGTAVYLDVVTGSGETRSSLDGTAAPTDGEQTVELNVRTGSGDVVLQRA